MCLTKFFLQVTLQKCVSRFFKREQFTGFAMALNKTKINFLKLQQHFRNTVCFLNSANSLTLNTVCIRQGWAIMFTRRAAFGKILKSFEAAGRID